MAPDAPWFGRDADLSEVRHSLEEPGAVVVTGPAGVGKSRLLGEVAAGWPGEVVRVDLHDVRTADAVAARVAAALGLEGATVQAVARALAGRPDALLVLDDAEHAAPHLGAALAAWGDHRVLVGSRVRPDGRARLVPLDPLPQADGEALYLDRARRLVPDWTPDSASLGALVVALDALPLALELAAARARIYPPAEMLLRLPDALAMHRGEGRHRSLVAALSVSWELLSEDTQQVLSQLARIRGTFGVPAFRAVTEADPAHLEDLLDASLIQLVRPGRMRMLETVRVFAGARLEASSREPTAVRHAQWVAAATEDALERSERSDTWAELDDLVPDLVEAGRTDPRSGLLLARIRAVRGPLTDPGSPPAGADPTLRVAWALTRSHVLSQLGRHEEALGYLARLEVSTPAEALRRTTQRVLHLLHMRPDEAVGWLPDLLAGLEHGTVVDIAEARLAAALALCMRADYAAARDHLEAGHAALRGADFPAMEARLLQYTAMMSEGVRFSDARVPLERAAKLFEQLGRPRRRGLALAWWGALAQHHGDLAAAGAALRESAEVARRFGDPLGHAEVLGHLVELALEEGRFDDAQSLLDDTRALPESPVLEALTRMREGLLALRRTQPSKAAGLLGPAAEDLARLGRPVLSMTARVYLAVALGPGPGADDALERAGVEADAVGSGQDLVTLARRGLKGSVEAPEEAKGVPLRMLLTLLQLTPVVQVDGRWIADRGGKRRPLGGKPVLKRLTATLAAAGPGALVGRAALVEGTWPGQRMRADSATGRLHAAVRTLRRLGLRDDLVTSDLDGELAYGLSADVRIVSGD